MVPFARVPFWAPMFDPQPYDIGLHTCPFKVNLLRNRWHWLRWGSFHLPGPFVFAKGHL